MFGAPAGNAGAGTGNAQFASALGQRVPSGPMSNIAQLIASGVFDRFPEMKIYHAEANASWLPGALFFIDDSYQIFKDWFGVNLKMLPSEYVKKHSYFSFIRDPMAMQLKDFLPWQNLMWGTDFPHSVGSFPDSRKWLDIIFKGVPDNIRRSVLLETPAMFYGLDLEKDITPTPKG
jgi:predicted TIM-barrel fold metal-dependent hydrolase